MTHQPFNVLFLCTGNSARSIMAESLINHWVAGKLRGFSAGSHPNGPVNPLAIRLLEGLKLPVAGARSKSWEEFSAPGAPTMDFVFTVCDQAASETCPVWPGHPITAHWGVADPAAVEGDETTRMMAFRSAFRELENRIRIFSSLPLAGLNRMRLQQEVDKIAHTRAPAPAEVDG